MATTTKTQTVTEPSEMELLLKSKGDALKFPKVGDLIEGKVISASKNEVLIDIEGVTTGIVRGKEIEDESNLTSELKVGDRAIATVIDLATGRMTFINASHCNPYILGRKG